MIRYPITPEELRAAISQHAPRWYRKAAVRTDTFAEQGRYTEENSLTPFWGDIKQVFIALQHKKCVYCEKPIEGGPGGAIEWDLEHFRPKGAVRPWKVPDETEIPGFKRDSECLDGYYLLAYHPGNYAAACKTCNTIFKSNCFPVAGRRIQGKRDPEEYRPERPYPVHPLDLGDDDPEALITFDGVTARPKPLRGHRRRRAQVTIALFGLNRDELHYHRAQWLALALAPGLERAHSGDAQAKRDIKWMLSPAAPFTNCCRCFVRLYKADRARSREQLQICREILKIERRR